MAPRGMALDDEARDDLEVERVASNEEEESGSEESVHEDAGTETTKEKTSRWKKKKHKRKESKGSDLSPRHSFQLDWTKPMKRSSMVLRKAYRGLHHKFAEFGHVPAEKQLQAVESLRFMLASEGLLRMEYDEYALHRFLRARQFNVEKALEMIKKNIRWREENQVEHIVSTFRFEEEQAFLRVYPQGYYKTDKQGRPIYYQKLGGVTWKKLTAVTTVERFLKYHIREYEKLVRYKFPACSMRSGRHIDQTLTILDLRDVLVSQFNSDARNLLKNIAAIDSDNYPEMMGRMVIINAPTSFKMVYAVVKTFIDKRTASKIEIYGSKYQQRLLELVDINNLPRELGGTSTEALLSNPGPWETALQRTRSDASALFTAAHREADAAEPLYAMHPFPERHESFVEEEPAAASMPELSLLDRLEDMESSVADSYGTYRSRIKELAKEKQTFSAEPQEWLSQQGSLLFRIQKVEQHVRIIREVQERMEKQAAQRANRCGWLCFSP
eukprot:scaffold102_cov340-Pavlova_lutheri.AAC.54